MHIGDHLVSTRLGYTHHGLYLGGDMVIHYSGMADGLSSGAIEITTVKDFSGDGGVSVRAHALAVHNVEQRVARAMSRLGEDRYNLITNNCEHFVNWCIDGNPSSKQVTRAWSAMASGVSMVSPVGGALFGGLGTVMTANQAAKLSDKPVEAVATSLTKTVATTAVAAVVAPAAIPIAVVAGVGTAAVYGIKKLISVFD